MSSNSNHSNWFKWKGDPEIQDFISRNAHHETSSLALKLTKYPSAKRNFILNQISCRQVAQKKLPEFASHDRLIYPVKQSLEQSSSELTARYKSSLFRGRTFLDLTAGFGVDSFYFSKTFETGVIVEKNNELVDLLRYNFEVLQSNKTAFYCNDAHSFLKSLSEKKDLIYVDPSRRKGNKRLLDIRDYDPNIVELSPLLSEKATNVLIKLSPVSDIQQIIRLIPNLTSLTVISVKNECKEILVAISEKTDFNNEILSIDLNEKSSRSYAFNLNRETEINLQYSDIKKYLYLPMTAVVKAGAFKSISKDFNVDKLSGNTHIYTSSEFVSGFPGKAFECIDTMAFNKKILYKKHPLKAFNVQCRNFPLKPEQVAKKLDIMDSGDLHLLAYRNRFEELQISVTKAINA